MASTAAQSMGEALSQSASQALARPESLEAPETGLLLVRLAVATKNERLLQLLFKDPDPAVCWLAERGADELDGVIAPRSHQRAINEAIRWGRAFKAGRIKRAPWGWLRRQGGGAMSASAPDLPPAVQACLAQTMGTLSFQAFLKAALEGRSRAFLHQHLAGGVA